MTVYFLSGSFCGENNNFDHRVESQVPNFRVGWLGFEVILFSGLLPKL
jgi:hypothetical protein